MYKQISLICLSTLILTGLLFLSTGCKKGNNTKEPQPDPVTALKSKVVGKWQLVEGSYTEYDAGGKALYTDDLANQTPAPAYDIQSNDILYATDDGGKKDFYYTLSVTADGRSRILLESVQYYDITLISSTDMTWIQDIKVPEDKPGNIRRIYTEIHFKKQ